MEAGSGSPRRQRRHSVLLILVAVILLVAVMTIVRVATERPVVDIASPHPLWTASISGTNGDIAEIWVWTPSATLRTNLPVPAELRFRERNLLLQVRSAQHRDMDLDVSATNHGSAHGTINAGASNSVDFQAYERIPVLPLGGFGCASLPTATFGVRPIFAKFPFLYPSGYVAVPDAGTKP